ncbi:MAG TPA: amidase, partial [Alphaproteobacteria bacterium]|nr:amidase [Alphaproteobacteria bacterium]
MNPSRDKLEQALARIADSAGEGGRAFLRVWPGRARAAADAADALAAAGAERGPLAGRIVSIKDLLDIKGEPTTAGSVVLRDAPPAMSDAPVVARLAAAGAAIVGKTNMTEFAYSGVGINPHYGTPGNPYDRARIPGGSSSGAAVAVADGMCEIAIGSDTGGSVRLPAALCGIVGFKPTARRVPTKGALPLSTSLDSIGPLARSVADCTIADAVLAGEAPSVAPPMALDGVRLLLATTTVLDGLDAAVSADFARALTRLSDSGARIVERKLELIERMAEANAGGGFAAAEAYAWHRNLLARHAEEYDPRVRARIERGKNMSAADYIA